MYSPSEIDFDKYDEPRLHMERLLRTHLTEFDLPLRVLIPLEDAGITRLGHLVKHSRKSLLKLNRVGKISVAMIEKLLERLDLPFAQD